MPGSSTTPGCSDARANASVHVAFRLRNSVGARDMNFARSMAGPCVPLTDASLSPLRTTAQRCTVNAHRLLSHRVGLVPTTSCRSLRRTAKDSVRHPEAINALLESLQLLRKTAL